MTPSWPSLKIKLINPVCRAYQFPGISKHNMFTWFHNTSHVRIRGDSSELAPCCSIQWDVWYWPSFYFFIFLATSLWPKKNLLAGFQHLVYYIYVHTAELSWEIWESQSGNATTMRSNFAEDKWKANKQRTTTNILDEWYENANMTKD